MTTPVLFGAKYAFNGPTATNKKAIAAITSENAAKSIPTTTREDWSGGGGKYPPWSGYVVATSEQDVADLTKLKDGWKRNTAYKQQHRAKIHDLKRQGQWQKLKEIEDNSPASKEGLFNLATTFPSAGVKGCTLTSEAILEGLEKGTFNAETGQLDTQA